MPRTVIDSSKEKGVIRFNFARVRADVCQIAIHLPNLELDDYLHRVSVKIKLSTVGNPTKKELYWNLSALGEFDTHEQHMLGSTTLHYNDKPGNLVNLAWAYTQNVQSIYNMMESICSRSIIELLTHSQEVDAEKYDIVQMYFAENHKFIINRLPIRPYKEALSAALEDPSESANEWMRLFEEA